MITWELDGYSGFIFMCVLYLCCLQNDGPYCLLLFMSILQVSTVLVDGMY